MATKTNHTVISCKDLSIGYRNKKKVAVIAKEISFSITEGTLVAMVGSNGIGKSTLLKTLTAMLPALSGSIQINGKETTAYSTLERSSKLSVVLTEAPASKNMSVIELVSLGRQPYTNWMGTLTQQDKNKILEALNDTDLTAFAHRNCFELSDGQLQRVYIARALAQDTPLIILDEPTTHLDLYHRAAIVKLLKKLTQEKNKTILFSTHEIDLAIQISDKMMVMTENHMAFNTPCNLIQQGAFDSLFPNEIVVFDKKTGRFSVT
ncbi:MAG: iron complex transport system ATP-binding protein [Candidatus Paceibacteria bacterium]|jgi:iron complex transport system ATP-binding protein